MGKKGLNMASKESYDSLSNLPSINGVTLEGNLTTQQLNVDKHFKGWWPDLATLKAAITATAGDAAYVKDASPATTWSIYVYDSTASSNNYWADSGTDADTSNVQTFESGEEVNETYIDNTHLANPVVGSLLKAEDAMSLKTALYPLQYSEQSVDTSTLIDYTPIEYPSGYYIKNGTFIRTTTNKSTKINVSGMSHIRFLGVIRKAAPSSGQPCYCFLDVDGNIMSNTLEEYGIDSSLDENILSEYSVEVPDGAVYFVCLYVAAGGLTTSNFYCYLATGMDIKDYIYHNTRISTIFPRVSYGNIRPSTGEFDNNANLVDRKQVCTPRFIRTKYPVSIKSSNDSINCRIYCYDKDFNYLGDLGLIQITANVQTRFFTLIKSTEYVKVSFFGDAVDGVNPVISLPVVSFYGYFDTDWDVFNIRPSDQGYHTVQALVNVTDPTCCDDDSQNVQDEPYYLTDYGVICLPSTYSNTGKPTRLIIYCHGSAVNYSSTEVRFNSVDLEPDYWLAEGYAVMDIEGNPFNNSDVHGAIPQSFDCYVAAYRWAIEHYNLCRDGVFVGGRSLGARTSILLSREEIPIPVIAVCPNAGPNIPTLSWNYANATRRKFWADHMGFLNQPTWTSDSPMPQAEWDCLKDNFSKLAKNTTWSLIVDLPDSNVLLSDNLNISKDAQSSQVEEDLYNSLHAKLRVPVKMFGCYEDTSAPIDRTSKLFARMFNNSAQIVELRLFHSYKDYSGTDTSAHHYDTQDPALRANVTTRYGEELTNIPIVYIEMLQFWRRFEQNN
jgi:hypothetical protein